jgi:hypothetical protein
MISALIPIWAERRQLTKRLANEGHLMLGSCMDSNSRCALSRNTNKLKATSATRKDTAQKQLPATQKKAIGIKQLGCIGKKYKWLEMNRLILKIVNTLAQSVKNGFNIKYFHIYIYGF